MGLFDFLGRRPSEPDPPAEKHGGPTDEEDSTDHDGPSLRYTLAHVALPQITLGNPVQILATAASPDSATFLPRVVQLVRDNVGREPDFDPRTLAIHPCRTGRFPCVIFEMPEPDGVTEAFYTAVVALMSLDEDPPENPGEVGGRYFTLEQGASFDGVPRTVFGEWTETSHLNYGDGPEPTIEGFAARIAEAVDAER